MDMTTDSAWEEWGRRDPYFGVITDPKFRLSEMKERSRREFFQSGESHVDHVLATIRKYIDPGFAPKSVLDFGCGVGRLLVSFAKMTPVAVGLDVSDSMLKEARLNCDERQLRNVDLLSSDDGLSNLKDSFDLIHSCIVFQHIPVARGRAIFAKLLQHLRPGGVGAVQLTYSKIHFAATLGVDPLEASQQNSIQSTNVRASPRPIGLDPEIQMNPYNMNQILFLMQTNKISKFHTEFTDHGGELGVFLFFQVALADADTTR